MRVESEENVVIPYEDSSENVMRIVNKILAKLDLKKDEHSLYGEHMLPEEAYRGENDSTKDEEKRLAEVMEPVFIRDDGSYEFYRIINKKDIDGIIGLFETNPELFEKVFDVSQDDENIYGGETLRTMIKNTVTQGKPGRRYKAEDLNKLKKLLDKIPETSSTECLFVEYYGGKEQEVISKDNNFKKYKAYIKEHSKINMKEIQDAIDSRGDNTR